MYVTFTATRQILHIMTTVVHPLPRTLHIHRDFINNIDMNINVKHKENPKDDNLGKHTLTF